MPRINGQRIKFRLCHLGRKLVSHFQKLSVNIFPPSGIAYGLYDLPNISTKVSCKHNLETSTIQSAPFEAGFLGVILIL